MTDNTNTSQQQTTTPTPEGTGGKMFTQDEVNKIVSDRLAREREKLSDGSEYKAKYEAVQKELEGMKAAQLHQQKEAAYRDLLARANIYDITLKSGEQITTDAAGAWRVCHDHTLLGDVVNVTADRPEYAELAGVIAALCR